MPGHFFLREGAEHQVHGEPGGLREWVAEECARDHQQATTILQRGPGWIGPGGDDDDEDGEGEENLDRYEVQKVGADEVVALPPDGKVMVRNALRAAETLRKWTCLG